MAGLLFLPLVDANRGIFAGALAIALIGVVDDVGELPAGLKLAGQFAAAMIPVFSGVAVGDFTFPFAGGVDLHGIVAHDVPVLGNVHVGQLLTLVGLVAMMNVINLIDGVDGLAAGVCVISAATLTVIALSLDRTGAAVLAGLTAGAALGFLRHGFPPASSFMGDTGSNLLGYLLGITAVEGALKTNAVVALFLPLLILAVPILDTGFVVAKRIKYKRPIYEADALALPPPHGEHRLLPAPHPGLPLRLDGRDGRACPGASLRALQRRPRPLQRGVDPRDARLSCSLRSRRASTWSSSSRS